MQQKHMLFIRVFCSRQLVIVILMKKIKTVNWVQRGIRVCILRRGNTSSFFGIIDCLRFRIRCFKTHQRLFVPKCFHGKTLLLQVLIIN